MREIQTVAAHSKNSPCNLISDISRVEETTHPVSHRQEQSHNNRPQESNETTRNGLSLAALERRACQRSLSGQRRQVPNPRPEPRGQGFPFSMEGQKASINDVSPPLLRKQRELTPHYETTAKITGMMLPHAPQQLQCQQECSHTE